MARASLLTVTAGVLVAGAGLGALPGAAGAATPYSAPSGRPHSRVVTYDRGTVRIEALQAAVTRVGGHLEVTATVRMKNLTNGPVTRFVRAGRCVRGSLAAPACKADVLFSFRAGTKGESTVIRRFTLRQPPGKVDAIELAVQPTARMSRRVGQDDGELLLRGTAWRGVGAGATYGVVFPARDDRAKRLQFDLPFEGRGRAYASVVWTGLAATTAPTTLGKCNGGDCEVKPLLLQRFRSSGLQFGTRFDLANDGRAAITLDAKDTDGTPLISAALPWPVPAG